MQDFLRQNNTGKVLWQVFGIEAVTLCLFGIAEHEEMMWNTFKRAGLCNIFALFTFVDGGMVPVKSCSFSVWKSSIML